MSSGAKLVFPLRSGSSLAQSGFLVTAILVTCIWCVQLNAQVAQSSVGGNQTISAGATGDIYRNSYGSRTLGSVGVCVDADWNQHYGLEAEGRWSVFNQRSQVNNSTYLIGPRYSFNGIGRFRPYAKVLIGAGRFRFPYDYAEGSYLVVAPGAGLDFRVNRRVRMRLIDAEYQEWPQFTYGALANYGVSAGFRIRLF